MKICLLTHDYPPGQGAALRYIEDVVNSLTAKGISVVVITLTHKDDVPLYEEGKNLHVYRLRAQWNPMLWNLEFMFRVGKKLKEVYEKEKFDLIHSEHVYPVWAAGNFAKKNDLPHIVTIEGITDVTPYSKFMRELHKFVLKHSHYDVLAIWGVFIWENYLSKWNLDKTKVVIIPGGVNTNRLHPLDENREVKTKLLEGGKSLIFIAKPLYGSNAIGIANAIRASKIVFDSVPDARLVIAGEGRKRNELENIVKELNLNEKIKFLGWVRQDMLPQYYSAADVVIDPIGFRHPGSITVLESLTTGKPLIINRIECLPGEQCIPTSEIAEVVEPNNPESMAKGIIKILKDEAYAKDLGRRAWNFVRTNFDTDLIADQYIKAYKKLLKQ
jgi:glycosyltransferase involved in cell wall biosynthesis